MKLGISMWSYVAAWKTGAFDIPAFIHECKRLGVDGVELLDFFWKDRAAETPAVMEALRETGLAVGVYSVSNEFVNPDDAARAAQVEVIKRGVDSALEFGAKTVRVFAGNQKEGIDFAQSLGWIIEGLSEAAEYAYFKGVTLALENHGKLAGRADQVETILKAVASPALKANPDTGNFLLVHDTPHDAVDRLATRAAMVHLKDFHLVPDSYEGFAYTALDGLKFVGKPLGDGDIDLADCIVSLKQAGFDGWVNIEYDAEIDPLEGVARSVQYANGLLGRN